jgi:hypothetical protein
VLPRHKKSGAVKRKSNTVPLSRSRKRTRSANKQPTAQTTEDLAVELYSLVRLALGDLGVTGAQQQRALERSRRLRTPPSVSGRILRVGRGVGAILREWSRKAQYLDSDGKPRVLAIAGPGATFESLAQRFLPDVPLEEVVALACENSEVVTRPGDKIALLGSILVKFGESRDKYLAHAIRQIDQLLQTLLHNRRVRLKGAGNGRMERLVIGIIPRANFKAFMAELRPQIYDLLLRVDSSVEHYQPKTARALRACSAVSVSVYVGQEDDFERAGADTSIATFAEGNARPKKRPPALRRRSANAS